MKLEKFEEITGVLTCLTGLRIGSAKTAIGIGEADNPILRHPITRLPYIPGSSLKGKLRSLLEQTYSQESQDKGSPCGCGHCFVCKLFGCNNSKNTNSPSRLIFRDSTLTQSTEESLKESLPGSFSEEKTEIRIDRRTGTAARGAVIPNERVPADSVFNLSISVRLFDKDSAADRREYLDKLAEAFEMLGKDYLGGNGTRGYGKVEVTHVAPDGTQQPMSDYLRGLTW